MLAAAAVVAQAVVASKPALFVVGVVLVAFGAWAAATVMETVRLEIDDDAGTLSIARKSFARTIPLASIASVDVTAFEIPGDLEVDFIHAVELVADGERIELLPASRAKGAQDWAATKVRAFLANAEPPVSA